MLFTHGNLWHRAGANLSSKPRVGLLCSFAASYMKEIASEEDQSIVISQEVKANASQRLSAILGQVSRIAFGMHLLLPLAKSLSIDLLPMQSLSYNLQQNYTTTQLLALKIDLPRLDATSSHV